MQTFDVTLPHLCFFFHMRKISHVKISCPGWEEGENGIFLVCFCTELGAQEASQWEHPSAEKTELVMKPGQMETATEPWQMESSEASLPPPLIVLENVREAISSFMLTMLVENISDLSEEDGDFTVEMIPELRAAVVAFTGNAGKEESGL